MKTRTWVAIVLTLPVLAGLALAQEEAAEAKPWEAWEPPEVEMPDPNAWDIYVYAFQIEEQIYERLREEAGLPPRGDEAADAAPPAPVAVGAQPNVALRLHMTEESLEPETLGRLIEAYAPVFSALEAAIAGDAVVPPIRSREDIEQAFREFAQARQAARMFASRSVYHLRRNDALSAALDAIAAMHISADTMTQHSLISGLVGIACQAIGEAQLRELIPLLDATEARITGNAMRRAVAETASLAEIMAGEAAFARAFFIEALAPAMGDAQRLNELYGDAELARAAAGVSAEQMWEQMLPFHEQRIALAARPYWARGALSAPDNPLLEHQVAAFERMGLKLAYMEARLRVDLAALAAQAYHGEQGAYPAGLDELAPDYLPGVPRDPFADAALRSIARDPMSRAHPAAQREPTGAGVLTIYSVGPDGDDDGGSDIGHDLEATATSPSCFRRGDGREPADRRPGVRVKSGRHDMRYAQLCTTIMAALALVASAAVAQFDQPPQDQGPKPWEQWQPPTVEMPDPNAFELYQLAFAMEEAIGERLREEADAAGEAEEPEGAAPPPAGEAGQEVLPVPTQIDMTDASIQPDVLRGLVAAYAPVFRLLEEAIAGEAQCPPLTDPAQTMPYFADIRQGARMFAGRSLMHQRDGDTLQAALDAIACVHLGADASTQGTLIAGLVAIACQAIGQRQLDAAIPGLDATGALAAKNALRRAMAERGTFADALRGEETFARLTIKQYLPMFEGVREAADEQIDPELAAQMRALDPAATWEELGAFYGAWIEEAGKPWYARAEVAEPANPLLATVAPSFEIASLKFAVADARLNVAVAALAAQAWLGEQGSLPTSLDALVPNYLPEVPRDPFADAPLRSEFREPVTRAHPAAEREPQGARVLIIYSIGPDGDDDGGADIGTRVDADSDGDIAFVLTME